MQFGILDAETHWSIHSRSYRDMARYPMTKLRLVIKPRMHSLLVVKQAVAIKGRERFNSASYQPFARQWMAPMRRIDPPTSSRKSLRGTRLRSSSSGELRSSNPGWRRSRLKVELAIECSAADRWCTGLKRRYPGVRCTFCISRCTSGSKRLCG